MARSAHRLCAAHRYALLLCAAATIVPALAGDVVTYSIPAFNATTGADFIALTNSSVFTSTSIFGVPADALNLDFNSSEGFLLLQGAINLWSPDREASFNTTFTLLAGAAPVSFVVLKGTFPPLNGPGGFRGAANYTMSPGAPVPSSGTGSLAAVEVNAVRSYGPDVPTAGLNVTVMPRGAALAVWVEYHAVDVHRLSVYVDGAGEARPAKDALINIPLGVEGHWTTETALVGFFAGRIRDIIVGVRDWNLTVDRLPVSGGGIANGKTGTSWLVVLLALLGFAL